MYDLCNSCASQYMDAFVLAGAYEWNVSLVNLANSNLYPGFVLCVFQFSCFTSGVAFSSEQSRHFALLMRGKIQVVMRDLNSQPSDLKSRETWVCSLSSSRKPLKNYYHFSLPLSHCLFCHLFSWHHKLYYRELPHTQQHCSKNRPWRTNLGNVFLEPCGRLDYIMKLEDWVVKLDEKFQMYMCDLCKLLEAHSQWIRD